MPGNTRVRVDGWNTRNEAIAAWKDPKKNFDLFELSDDAGEAVHVKPCRRCFQRHGNIVQPDFTWFSDDVNYVNNYRVSCPKCENGMVAAYDPENVEERWNDWDKPLEEWEEDLDW